MFRFFRKIGAFILDFVETVIMALAVFVIIYLFLFQPHQVRGNSMLPSFEDKEYILTDKISYRLHSPARGDVIIFRAPQNEDYDYIKRIIGIPGDTIRIENGRVYVNEEQIEEPYLPEDEVTIKGRFVESKQSMTVPEDQYFVLGDNRNHSSDSREWGFVPKENIIGKTWFRYWPPGRIGLTTPL
jgi:signal peptidase I